MLNVGEAAVKDRTSAGSFDVADGNAQNTCDRLQPLENPRFTLGFKIASEYLLPVLPLPSSPSDEEMNLTQ
jgi:hypothetical protein